MSTETLTLQFQQPDLASHVSAMSAEALDELPFGVIGIDADGVVRLYNRYESQFAGLSRERVIGNALFTVVAPCMNNFMVAQRLEDAKVSQEPLDASLDYVFTLKMRPTKVKLRLLAIPGHALRYVLVRRAG